MSFRSEKLSWIYLITAVFAIFSLWNSLVCLRYFSNFILFISYLFIFLFCSHGDFFSLSSQWFWIFMPFFFPCCSVAQSCLTLCDPIDRSMPGFPVLHQSLLKLMSIESMMPSNHLILCPPLLLPSIFSSIRVFSNDSVLQIRWPKYWGFSFSPSSEYSGLISFRIDWFDFLAVQEILKSLFLSNTTVGKHQFFGAQPSLWSNSHIHTRLLEKP